jgi:dihydrofolate synthase/folylpolyglutamate synthase
MLRELSSEPQEILELFSKRTHVIKPGLDRVRSALSWLGFPGSKTFKIVIGGTNGKGSTSGMVWRLLAGAGLRVGLFTSPHLVEFRERIAVSDREIRNDDLVRHILALKSQLPPVLWDELTFFEINTILAFLVFDEVGTDVNVLEVGMGGRLDCVNVYDPDVAVITSVGLDHVEYLGPGLVDIAREKAGIMRPGRPVIWGGLASSDQEAHNEILLAAHRVGSRLVSFEQLPGGDLPRQLQNKPEFLQRNFILARTAVQEALIALKKDLPIDLLVRCYDDPKAPWPVSLNGRFDFMRLSKADHSINVLLDVCHNPHGARALATGLANSPDPRLRGRRKCLISVLADKDVAGIWGEIKSNIGECIGFQIPSPRTWTHNPVGFDGFMTSSFDLAWQEALRRSSWVEDQPWLIFGSVAAVGHVMRFWQENGWIMERIPLQGWNNDDA